MHQTRVAVLEALFRLTAPDGEMCVPFLPIQDETRFPRATVRRECRALARNGLAEFHNGLWSIDRDQPAGAGYCITKKGIDFIQKERSKPTDEDFDDMLHALGRPKDVTKETYRNHFCCGWGSSVSVRFEETGCWDFVRFINDGKDAIYSVNGRGKQLLAEWMKKNNENI